MVAAVVGRSAAGIVPSARRLDGGTWRSTWQPYFLTLMCISTIRVGSSSSSHGARRFGGRGLAVVAFVAAVLGPVRDYRYMATFPEWAPSARLAPMFQFLWRMSSWEYWATEQCGWSPALPGRPAGAPAMEPA